MSPINNYIPTLFHIVVCVYTLVRLYRMMNRTGRSVQLVFFAFGVVAYILTDLYWVAFDLLYPMDRMPFAANEICECAIFLSFASVLVVPAETSALGCVRETAGAMAFLAANVGLWIAWSGEWVQDIISGIVIGCFLVRLVRHIKHTGALSAVEWKISGAVCVLVTAANVATFYVEEPLKDTFDLTVSILMLSAVICSAVLTIICLTVRKNAAASVSLSFFMYAWSSFFLYMSAGFFYNVASFCCSAATLLMFETLRREALS